MHIHTQMNPQGLKTSHSENAYFVPMMLILSIETWQPFFKTILIGSNCMTMLDWLPSHDMPLIQFWSSLKNRLYYQIHQYLTNTLSQVLKIILKEVYITILKKWQCC